jgi:hypothetical protein
MGSPMFRVNSDFWLGIAISFLLTFSASERTSLLSVGITEPKIGLLRNMRGHSKVWRSHERLWATHAL